MENKEIKYTSEIFDPNNNVWIDANAGSGKTTALKNRFISLLLSGVSYENIYCITYTNIAAEEMKTRILKTLKDWSTLSDEAVFKDLTAIFQNPTNNLVSEAKSLYSKLVDSLEDFKISTIHSLAQRIIGFEKDYILDEDSKIDSIIDLAIDQFLSSDFSEEEQESFNFCIKNIGYYSFKEALQCFLKQEYIIGDVFFEDAKEIYSEKYFFNLLKSIKVPNFIEGKKAQDCLTLFNKATTTQEIFNACLTQKFVPRSIKSFEEMFEEVFAVHQRFLLNNHNLFFNSLRKLIPSLLANYRKLKTEEKLISFDECLYSAEKILEKNEFSLVKYFFDLNISHLMLDESQDTNPLSWKIINKITEDFFTGFGLHDNIRTMFVVGDKKQSIFSFQGASVDEYEKQKAILQKKSKDCDIKFVEEFLTKSYRCGSEILKVVDKFIHNSGFKDGFGSNVSHLADKNYQSDVKLHLINEIKDLDNLEDDKFDWVKKWHMQEIDKSSLAYLFADKIKTIIEEKISQNSEEEILILFPNRTSSKGILYNILSVVEDSNLPISGIDKINIKQSICFNDVMLLLKVASNPLYDSDLIALLRSPFFDISLDDVLSFYKSKDSNMSLFEYMEGGLLNPLFIKDVVVKIKHWIEKIYTNQIQSAIKDILFDQEVSDRFIFAYKKEFFSTLTTIFNILQKIPLAQSFSLDCVLKYLMDYEEITFNDANESCNIKFSTIHGAKGTEADTVILIETSEMFASKGKKSNQDYFLEYCNEYFIAISDLKKLNFYKDLIEKNKESNDLEKARLLYVAFTRAKKSLHVISNMHDKERSCASILSEIL